MHRLDVSDIRSINTTDNNWQPFPVIGKMRIEWRPIRVRADRAGQSGTASAARRDEDEAFPRMTDSVARWGANLRSRCTGSRIRDKEETVMIKARIEVVLAGAFTGLAVLTALWPQWIEELTGLEPDAGSGVVEWAIVVVLAGLAATATVLARSNLRRARATT